MNPHPKVFLIAALTRPNVCSAALEELPPMWKCLTAHLMGAARRWIQRNRANLEFECLSVVHSRNYIK